MTALLRWYRSGAFDVAWITAWAAAVISLTAAGVLETGVTSVVTLTAACWALGMALVAQRVRARRAREEALAAVAVLRRQVELLREEAER
jgi:hypothetical protein